MSRVREWLGVGAVTWAMAACSASSLPPSPSRPPTVLVDSEPARTPPGGSGCEVVATVVGPEGAPTTERRTATDCRGAYEAFDDTRAWVRSVDGVTAGPELTEAWNVPTTAGDATCAVVFGIARARATGHAEGEGADDVSDLAKQDACRQLGLTGADCDARARVHQTSKKMLFVNGQTSSEATVEVVVYERAEGEGRGATKLDACRAAIASACEAERCDGDTLVVEHIDDVPLRRHAVLPTRGLFDRPETAR